MLMHQVNDAKQLAGHVGVVGSLAVSSAGDIAISGAYLHYGAEEEIRIWDLSSGKQLRYIRTGFNGIFGLACSLDCQYIVAGGGGAVVRDNWQYTSGIEVWRFDGTGKVARFGKELFFIKSIAFSPDGKLLLTSNLRSPGKQGGDDEPRVRVWRASDFKEMASFGRHEVGIASASFSTDGQCVVFASNRTGGELLPILIDQ